MLRHERWWAALRVRGLRVAARWWMIVGAVAMGMATSPVAVLAMQPSPQGGGRVRVTGGASWTIPPAPSDPCMALATSTPDATLAALEHAAQGSTLAEIRSRIPQEHLAYFEAMLAGAWRFDHALFGQRGLTRDQSPVYVLIQQPEVGVETSAFASEGQAFAAELQSMDELDLASGLEGMDPSITLRPGDAAWTVTGTGARQGVVREFTGMLLRSDVGTGLAWFLIVHRDSICPDFALLEDGGGPGGGPTQQGCDNGGIQIPPGLPGVGWPRPPVIGPGEVCWDRACIEQKIQAYYDAIRNAIATLDWMIRLARDLYWVTVAALRTATIAFQIRTAILLLHRIAMCLWAGFFGPWAIVACMARVVLVHIAYIVLREILFQLAKWAAIRLLNYSIDIAISIFQWAVYEAYQQMIRDLMACWICIEELPPAFPQIPQPPWWPLDPEGPFKPCRPSAPGSSSWGGPYDAILR